MIGGMVRTEEGKKEKRAQRTRTMGTAHGEGQGTNMYERNFET